MKADIEPWESMTFILNTDWSFNIEYDISEEISDFAREIIWAYEKLDIYPEDEYEQQLLKEYLEGKKR